MGIDEGNVAGLFGGALVRSEGGRAGAKVELSCTVKYLAPGTHLAESSSLFSVRGHLTSIYMHNASKNNWQECQLLAYSLSAVRSGEAWCHKQINVAPRARISRSTPSMWLAFRSRQG